MSLQPALPSSGRSRLALAAALLVVMALAAGGALLWRPLTSMADGGGGSQIRKLTVCKEVEDDGVAPNNESWTFTFTVSWGNTQQDVYATATEGGDPGCSGEINVPKNVAVTVTENGRPTNWAGDVSGYPKYRVGSSGSFTGGSQVTIQVGNSNVTVTFKNKEVPTGKLQICKKWEDNDDGLSVGSFDWSFTYSKGQQSGTATVSVAEGSFACTDIIVPTGTYTVNEGSGRPTGWGGDAPGYPKAGEGDKCTDKLDSKGITAKVEKNKTTKVTFCNKERTGNIQIHKYIPKQNPSPNAPWENQGKKNTSPWTFTVYASLQDAQNKTNALATFSQLGNNSPDLPLRDLYIRETGMPSGYQFFGWYVPDGDGDSGDDKCNQKPLDGTGLDTSVILHIPANYWSTKGNKNGLLHICAYNKPTTRSVEICKIVEKNNDGNNDSGDFKFELIVGQTLYDTVTINAVEGGTGEYCATRSVPADASVKVIELTDRPGDWTTDASGYPLYKIGDGGWSQGSEANLGTSGTKVTFKNKDSRSQTVTFIKVICPTYGDVPANENRTAYDQTGGPAGELNTTYQTGMTNPSTDIPQNCQRAPGWSFDLW